MKLAGAVGFLLLASVTLGPLVLLAVLLGALCLLTISAVLA